MRPVQSVDHGCDLLFGHAARRGARGLAGAQAGFGGELAGLGVGDPLADHRGITADVQRGPVLVKLPLAGGDLLVQAGGLGRGFAVLGCCQRVERGGQVPWIEGLGSQVSSSGMTSASRR